MAERPVRVVLVENEHLDIEDSVRQLQFLAGGAEVEALSAEHEFRSRLPAYRENPPDVVVLGAWFRYIHPTREPYEVPAEVVEGGYHRTAGLRCQRLLAQDPRTADIPVIIWDDFEADEMRAMFGKGVPGNVHFVSKLLEGDRQLAVQVNRMLKPHPVTQV